MYIDVDYNPTPADTFFISVGLSDKEALSFDYTTKGHRIIKQILVERKKDGVQNLDKNKLSGGWDVIELKDGKFLRRYHVDWVDKGKIDEVNDEVWRTVWSKSISEEIKNKLLYWSQLISDNYEKLDEFQEKMKEFEVYIATLVKKFTAEKLTEGEEKYLATITDDKMMVVKPFNPKGLEIADQIIKEIKSVEPGLEILLLGSLPLKIAGQEDIDISAFCVKSEQPKHIDTFKKLFGEPTRIGKNSIGWDFKKEGFDISVWLTDPTVETTKAQVEVFNLLKNDPNLLKEYERIKVEAKDLPYKEYQRRKYEFYHKILKGKDS